MRQNQFVLRYWLQLFWMEHAFIYIQGILICGALIAALLAHTLILEIKSAQISFTAFYLRSISILFFLFIVPFYFIRLHQSHEIIYLLAQACSRAQFLFQTIIAFILCVLALCCTNCVLLLAISSPILQTFYWCFSLFLECSILVSISLFLSTRLVLASVASLFVLMFYGLGRLRSLIMASILHSEPSTLTSIMKIILKLMPAFDLFTQTDWLLNSMASPAWTPLITETLLFLMACFTLAILTYQKRWI